MSFGIGDLETEPHDLVANIRNVAREAIKTGRGWAGGGQRGDGLGAGSGGGEVSSPQASRRAGP